ncbi:MAG: hypothetical protein PHE27_05955 [Alphaproteobacteria bacterium]|nr:hypothetical protein [Alphaproteobacteria bacterium]
MKKKKYNIHELIESNKEIITAALTPSQTEQGWTDDELKDNVARMVHHEYKTAAHELTQQAQNTATKLSTSMVIPLVGLLYSGAVNSLSGGLISFGTILVLLGTSSLLRATAEANEIVARASVDMDAFSREIKGNDTSSLSGNKRIYERADRSIKAACAGKKEIYLAL